MLFCVNRLKRRLCTGKDFRLSVTAQVTHFELKSSTRVQAFTIQVNRACQVERHTTCCSQKRVKIIILFIFVKCNCAVLGRGTLQRNQKTWFVDHYCTVFSSSTECIGPWLCPGRNCCFYRRGRKYDSIGKKGGIMKGKIGVWPGDERRFRRGHSFVQIMPSRGGDKWHRGFLLISLSLCPASWSRNGGLSIFFV